jgi:flagellar hook-basal body complex protein FliE
MAISRVDISETLSKIRAISNKTDVFGIAGAKPADETRFSQIMSVAKDSISSVNEAQLRADSVREAYLTGDSNVSLSQVMMTTMKSRVAFEGLLVVRNKLLEAYKEIMNMPV